MARSTWTGSACLQAPIRQPKTNLLGTKPMMKRNESANYELEPNKPRPLILTSTDVLLVGLEGADPVAAVGAVRQQVVVGGAELCLIVLRHREPEGELHVILRLLLLFSLGGLPVVEPATSDGLE